MNYYQVSGIDDVSYRQLEEIGFGLIGLEEVEKRMAKLLEENENLSRDVAYKQAVLEIAEEKYGEQGSEGKQTMNGFLSAEDINKAWSRASLLIRDYAEAEAERVAAKIHLDRAEMHALAEGVEGKNAEERKAALYQRLEPLHDKLQMKEEEAARVKMELDVARNEQERVRMLMRLLENVDEFGVMQENGV